MIKACRVIFEKYVGKNAMWSLNMAGPARLKVRDVINHVINKVLS